MIRQNLLPIIFAVLFALAFSEAMLSACPSLLPWPLRYQLALPAGYDGELGVVQPPGMDVTLETPEFVYHVSTIDLMGDGVGFRDDGIDGERPILALGDSMTWGPGVEMEETWPEILERETGRDVVNMGMAGASTVFEANLLRRYGAKLRPSLVIVAFFPNDVMDNVKERGRLLPLRVWLHNHLALYETVKYGLGLALGIGPYAPPPGDAFVDVGFVDSLNLRLMKDNPMLLKEYPLSLDKGWQATWSAMWDIQAQCDKLDAGLLVVAIPTKEQTYWHYLEPHVTTGQYDPNHPNRMMGTICRNMYVQSIPFLDLTPAFRAHSDEQLYWPIDGHWNQAGHRLAAEVIEEWLNER